MRKSGISSILVLGLVASLLQLAPAAHSNVQTVVKTFKITKSTGTDHSGVSVALFGFDEDTNEVFLSDVAVTDTGGNASLTVASNLDYFGWSAQPAKGDLVNALFTDYSVSKGQAETLFATLKRANLIVELKNSDGSDPALGASIYFPSTDDGASSSSYKTIIRADAFGIDVSPALVATGSYSITAEPNATPSQFAAKYGLKAVGNPVTGFSIFTDTTYATQLQATSSVFTLAFSGPNFLGQLRNASGGALTIPAGVRVFAQVLKANADGSVNLKQGEEASSFFQVASNGTFSSKIYTPTAGKYFVQFTSSGSTSIPTFLASPFWINGSGSYSTSENGIFQASNVFSYSASIPANPNLKIRSTKSNGTANSNIYISLNQRPQNGGDEIWWGYASASNGVSSFSMPDGAYRIFIDPTEEGLLRAEYRVVIDQGVAFVSTETGSIINADSAGVFQLALGTPNLQVRLVRPGQNTTLLNDANVDIFRNTNAPGDNFVTSGYARSGIAALSVPNGSYTLNVNPFGGSLAVKEYNLEVSGSSIVISDGDLEIAPVNGVFTLTANVANITGVVEELIEGVYFPFSPRGQKWASVNIETQQNPSEPNRWDFYTSAGVGSGGAFAAFVSEEGRYRISVRVNGAPNAVATTFEPFTISDSSTIMSFTGESALKLRTPTLQIRVQQAGSTQNLEGASVEISNDELYEGYDTGSSGIAGIAIETAGDYQIQVRAPYNLSSAVAATKTYTLEATPSGNTFSLVMRDPAGNLVNPASDGVFDLSLGVPNVVGKITSSSGAAFDRSAGNYAWIEVERRPSPSDPWQWVNISAEAFEDGSFGLTIEEPGTYRLRIDPFGVANSSNTRTAQFVVSQEEEGDPYLVDGAAAKNFGTFRLSAPTAFFKVREEDSSEDLRFTGIEVRKDGEWLDWLNVGNDGLAKFTATEIGTTYEFTPVPNDTSDNSVRKTYTGEVTQPVEGGPFVLEILGVTEDSSGAFVLELGTPNVSGRLVDQDGAAVVNEGDSWTWVQVQKYIESEDRWDWTNNGANVRADGKFALSVDEPGTYRLRIESGGRPDLALTYSAAFTVTQANLQTFNQSFGNIEMNAPALAGSVLNIDGEPQSGSQVIAIDVATGQEMWEYAASTDSSGNWGMLLPAGTYKIYARPAWRDSTQGNSFEVTGVVVAADGQATVTGFDADAIVLQLQPPTWSGTVVEDLSDDPAVPISNASVCIFVVQDQRGSSSCTESNSEGRWALSKPSGFTGFNSDSTLTIRANQNPEFAEARFVGRVAIEAVLGVFDDEDTFQGIQLAPAVPNATFTIKAGANAAVNAWVSVHVVLGGGNRQWIAGSNTDSLGKVRFNLPTDKDFVVEVQPNSGTDFTAVRRAFDKEVLDSGPFDAPDISLGTPNLRGVVADPDGAPVRDAWVEIYDISANEWIGGSGTNALGQFSLGLEVPDSDFTWYRITAHPSGSGSGNLLSRSTFFAKVSAEGPVVQLFSSIESTTPISPESNIYTLALRAPTATGFVFLPNGTTPVRDSYVVPVDVDYNNRQLWELGQNSRANGTFGLALEDGNYKVFANVPGQLSNYSRSAMCSVAIAGGAVTSPTSDCVDANKNINLKLREPNLTFTLLEPLAQGESDQVRVPVANAHVGISVGEWYGWAQSSQDGTVSLLIDQDEIAENNPSWTRGSLPIRVNVQAPDENSELASWQCSAGENKPVCSDSRLTPVTFGQNYTNGVINLGNIRFLGANTFVNVLTSDSDDPDPASRAWVSVFKQESGGWTRYIASASTNSEGRAALYVDPAFDTAGALFTVEIHPPWELRTTEARRTISGLTLAEVQDATFALARPNLTLTILQSPSDRRISRWSNVWIEEVYEDTFDYKAWVNGYGGDDSGVIPISLAENKTYRINVNPGPGSVGTRTSCIVSVAGDGSVSKVADQCSTGSEIASGTMDLKLSAGNFTGSVRLGSGGGDPANGAIVFAQARILGTETLVAEITQETVVDSEGNYGLQLDPAYDWEVRVFYVNPPGAPTQYSSISTPEAVARNGNVFTGRSFVLPVR
jgi:hypothetical protein